MARYFFNVHDRFSTPADTEGVELSDLPAARRYAVYAARSLICDDVAQGIIDLNGTIEVVDEAGDTVLRIPFQQAVVRAAT